MIIKLWLKNPNDCLLAKFRIQSSLLGYILILYFTTCKWLYCFCSRLFNQSSLTALLLCPSFQEIQLWQIIFASSEAVLTTNRKLLKNECFNKDLKIIAIGESHWIKKWCELYKIYHLGPSYEDIKSIVQYSIKWANKVVKMGEILVKKHKKRGFLAFFKDRVHTPTLFYNTSYDLLYCVYIFMQFA